LARYDLTPGQYDTENLRLGVVAARFNKNFVTSMLQGAMDTLAAHGVTGSAVELVQVPGAFEIPLAAKMLIDTGRVEAIIALGAVVRGDTPHFDYVATACARGVARVSLDTGIPVIFGVLTTDTPRQATERAGGRLGNAGENAAHAALEMVALQRRLGT